MLEQFEQIAASAMAELDTIKTAEELENYRVKYLGRKGLVTNMLSQIGSLPPEQKKQGGQTANRIKQQVTEAFESKKQDLGTSSTKQGPMIDVTLPGASIQRGRSHILTQTVSELLDIFGRMGFQIAYGPEIEDEWHNFSALNIPLDHPSRDAFDTFYLDLPEPREKQRGKFLLRSHTSPSQARVLNASKPPIAVVSPGRVYRPDSVDASHSFMFQQVEGFAVDENISFAHLKGVLLNFAKLFFASDVNLRLRPHFFPFTEPSAEVDISCFICKGKKDKCSLCKGKGWIEILGCGMIHPKVLKNCGINPKKYKGFAFGMGVERPAMLKYGINDIRLFYENDIKFLEQF